MLAIIGGTGLYDLPGLQLIDRLSDTTPFGMPSGGLLVFSAISDGTKS
jgi:purine nucleoside phosphorylase